MTPDELQKATSEVEKQASKLNEELTQIIADGIMHRFEKYGEVKLSASDEYRIKTLKRAGVSYGDIMEAIRTKTKGLEAEIKKVFKQSATNLGNVKVNSYVQKKANEPIKQNESGTTVKKVKTGFINENDLSQRQKEILNDVYERTQNELSDFYGKTAYNGVKIYQQAVDEAIHKIQSGIGWQKAVRDAIKEVAKKGMYVEYPSGRVDTIETAILRAVRTGVNQANSKLVLERATAEGQDLILVSSHLDARPTHQIWQGKIYSLSGNSKKYPEFYSSTGYGMADGLCGINCRHTIIIYYPGITRNPFKRYNRPVNVKRYELSQRQRKMEREIRKTRRRKNVLENSKKNTDDLDLKRQLNEEISKETIKLRQQKEAYNDFVEANQLKKSAIRTYAPKYDAAELKKAVGAAGNVKNKMVALESDGDLGRKIRKYFGKDNIVDKFRDKLSDVKNKDVKILLEQSAERVKFIKDTGRRSFYEREDNSVHYGTAATPGTIAHELFHEIDSTYGLTENGFLNTSVRTDYNKLLNLSKGYGKSIEEMLYSRYPEALKINQKGNYVVYEKYRGISDILHGVSNGKIDIGYGHRRPGYWSTEYAVEKETFAQFGRMFYEQDEEVLKMLKELFGETYNEVIARLEGMIK